MAVPFIIYLAASILVVLLAKYVSLLLIYINLFYLYLNSKLVPLFTYLDLSPTLVKIFLLVMIPLILAAIPALIYRAIKRKNMPHFTSLLWFLWLILVLSKVLIH
jgi:hypothetical protein